ncbi:MAG: heavy-metal-associated domain-containing protein [Bacteroidota bacterium]|nr:heavy-metal-associated domain-containing protein [Bacteroidota bacterium]
MNKVLIFLGLVAIVAIAGTVGNCSSGFCTAPNATVKNNITATNAFMVAATDNPKTVQLKITGMDCAMCTNAIHKKLSQTNGIIKDGISYENGSAIITYDPAKITVEKIIKVIEDTGYKATVVKENNAQKA